MTDYTAVITGASKGIGLDLAQRLLKVKPDSHFRGAPERRGAARYRGQRRAELQAHHRTSAGCGIITMSYEREWLPHTRGEAR